MPIFRATCLATAEAAALQLPENWVLHLATGLNNVCACAELWRAKIGHDNNPIENGGVFKIL